jgi:hypothetical protein
MFEVGWLLIPNLLQDFSKGLGKLVKSQREKVRVSIYLL